MMGPREGLRKSARKDFTTDLENPSPNPKPCLVLSKSKNAATSDCSGIFNGADEPGSSP